MFFETMIENILDHASSTNEARERGMIAYSHFAHGCLWEDIEILRELGHTIDLEDNEKGDLVFIKRITVNNMEIYTDGKRNENNIRKLLNIRN